MGFMELNKFLILSGICCAFIFLIVAVPLGFFFPGYDHLNDVISEQGAIDSPIMFQTNALFFLLGAFLFFFGLGLYRVYAMDWTGKTGSTLITLSGISATAVGFLPCDPGCINVSIIGDLHQAASEIPLILAAVALIFIAIQEFRVGGLGKGGKNNPWFYFVVFYLIIGIVFGLLHMELDYLFQYRGLVQRIAIGIPMSLVAIVSFYLYRKKFRKT